MPLTSNSLYYAFPDPPANFQADANFVWDTGSLSWVKMTQPAGGGGGAVTIADGADVNSGSTTDAAVITDTTGTISGKLRGLVKWAFERMPVSLGQKAMTGSLPVVLASDQSSIPVAATQSGAWSTGRTWVLASGTDSVAAVQSGAWTVQQGTPPWSVSQSGAWSTGRTWVLASGTDSVAAVQSGAWSVSVTGTATIAGTVSTKTDLAPSAPAVFAVGVASALALAANATRRGLVLVNVSNARISLGFGSPAVLNSGVTLFPRDSFSMDEYSFDQGAVNAIASIAASNLAIQEFSA